MPSKVGLCKTENRSKDVDRLVANGTPSVKSDRALYQGNGGNSNVKVLGLECVTCLRLMKVIFIVVPPIWQFPDCSILNLPTKVTPLDSSIVIATNLGGLDHEKDPRRLWRRRTLIDPSLSCRP